MLAVCLFCCSTSSQLLYFLIICNDKLKIPYVSANNSVSLSPVNCTDAAQIKADEEKAQKPALRPCPYIGVDVVPCQQEHGWAPEAEGCLHFCSAAMSAVSLLQILLPGRTA